MLKDCGGDEPTLRFLARASDFVPYLHVGAVLFCNAQHLYASIRLSPVQRCDRNPAVEQDVNARLCLKFRSQYHSFRRAGSIALFVSFDIDGCSHY